MLQNEKEQYNYGWALLKILCTFAVSIRHFYFACASELSDFVTLLAVPCFTVISFYYSETAINGDVKALLKRIYRFAYPMWG